MNFSSKNIFIDLDIKEKDLLFQFVSDQAKAFGITDNSDLLLQDLRKRESQSSSGIQDGFAIPHTKSSQVKQPSIFYLGLKNPMEWETYDGKDVSHVFCLLVPDQNESNTHLAMLSKLATCIMEEDFRKQIKTASDSEELNSYILKKMEEK